MTTSQTLVQAETRYTLEDLKRVMERLRDPEGGCPWDQKQSFETIITYTLEECYELAEAIEQDDLKQIAEELGDVLFQVVFYSQLGSELGAFDLDTVIDALVRKLVRRHPHVFVGEDLESRPEHEDLSVDVIKDTWERLKQEEREQKNAPGLLDDVPYALPALSRAQKLQKRAARVGFDWPDISMVVDKIVEESRELAEAQGSGDHGHMTEEFGDLLFVIVNLGRHLNIDAEEALRAANSKFTRRFKYIEEQLAAKNSSPAQSDLEEMDALWNAAKRIR